MNSNLPHVRRRCSSKNLVRTLWPRGKEKVNLRQQGASATKSEKRQIDQSGQQHENNSFFSSRQHPLSRTNLIVRAIRFSRPWISFRYDELIFPFQNSPWCGLYTINRADHRNNNGYSNSPGSWTGPSSHGRLYWRDSRSDSIF